jgi:hypothetical protein
VHNDCSLVKGNGFVQIKLETSDTAGLQQGSAFVTHNDAFATAAALASTLSPPPPASPPVSKLTVYCENQWIVIQQRENGFETSFNRTWREYAAGFGSLRGDFWLGLDSVHRLTHRRQMRLLVELTDWSEQTFVAEYDKFAVGSEHDNYRLSLATDKYTGNASRSMLEDIHYGFLSQSGAQFCTYDRPRGASADLAANSSAVANKQAIYKRNCALRSGGGWWFSNSATCLPVNLNGMYVTGASAPSARGIKWQAVRTHDRNYALKKSKMKIKPN